MGKMGIAAAGERQATGRLASYAFSRLPGLGELDVAADRDVNASNSGSQSQGSKVRVLR